MKKPWLAGLLSFIFPGIGQFYIGKVAMGCLFLFLYIVTIILSGGIAGDFFILIGTILFPIVWIVNIIQAVVAARKINSNVTPEN